jgi:hypothetical protein
MEEAQYLSCRIDKLNPTGIHPQFTRQAHVSPCGFSGIFHLSFGRAFFSLVGVSLSGPAGGKRLLPFSSKLYDCPAAVVLWGTSSGLADGNRLLPFTTNRDYYPSSRGTVKF